MTELIEVSKNKADLVSLSIPPNFNFNEEKLKQNKVDDKKAEQDIKIRNQQLARQRKGRSSGHSGTVLGNVSMNKAELIDKSAKQTDQSTDRKSVRCNHINHQKIR